MANASDIPAQPLSLLASRFDANCKALAERNPALAERLRAHPTSCEHFIGVRSGSVVLVRRQNDVPEILPDPVPPQSAKQIASSLFRTNQCTEPVAVVGMGYGWLWNTLFTLPTPDSYKPPLYFLVKTLDELWRNLHLHDWQPLLSDPRTHVFAGHDAVAQFQQALTSNPRLPLPRLSLDIDPTLWPAGATYQNFADAISKARQAQHQQHHAEITRAYAALTKESLAQTIRAGKPLRVLGLASRRSSFLQYSLRDWLAEFEALGHTAKLLIEDNDSEILDQLSCTKEIADFKPDVLLLLNHCRAEAPWLPKEPISVTWIQDEMPKLLSPDAGAKQSDRDFVVGYGRQECVHQYHYPPTRFLGARIGVNDARFSPAQNEQFACDVSYVSHAGLPAEHHLRQCLSEVTSPNIARVIRDVYDRLHALYQSGGSITEAMFLRQLIDQSATSLRITLDDRATAQLNSRVMQTINNAFFRHQSLEWLIDAGVDLRLYGKGWESHPRLKPFARGVADNESHLRAIYQSSKINLQIIPHGVVHQRLCDGLASGAFFLLRYCGADVTGPIFQRLHAWRVANAISDDVELCRKAPPEVLNEFDRLGWLMPDPDAPAERMMLHTMERHATEDWRRFSNSIWPLGADPVSNVYRPIWSWCRDNAIASDADVWRRAPEPIRKLLQQVGYFHESHLAPRGRWLVTFLERHAEEGYDRCAGNVFPEYDQVTFQSREQLLSQVSHFLQQPDDRRSIAASMRRTVLDKFTYRSITQRLLSMISSEFSNASTELQPLAA